MITKRESILSQILVVVQVLISLLLFLCLHLIVPQTTISIFDKIFFSTQIMVVWGLLFSKFRLGIVFRETPFFNMLRGYVATIMLGGFLFLFEVYALRFAGYQSYSLRFILTFLIVNLLLLIVFKWVMYFSMRYIRKIGYNTRSVMIIGDVHAESFIQSFIKAKDWGYRLTSVVTPSDDFRKSEDIPNVHVVKKQETLKHYITVNTVDDIFYCMSVKDERYNPEQLLQDAAEIGVNVHLMDEEVMHKLNENPDLLSNHDHLFKTYQTTPDRYIGLKIKDLFDFGFSAFILVVLSPLFLLIALLLKLQDGGPIFFKQERIGRNGRRFNCLKFRSMVIDAEALLDDLKDQNEADGPAFKIENDPRITKLGRFLRKTSLDELPQFYNVLKGDMSIVGPRPPLLKEVKQYERSQIRRLSMKPGITCIWQVKGRNKVSFKEWMEMDLEYIDNWSLWLDLKLFFATICVVFKANGR